MARALVKKQLLELFAFLYQSGKTGKRRSAAALLGYGLLLVYAFGAIGFLIYEMADTLCGPLVAMDLGWLFFALVGLLATFMGVVGSVFSTYSTLYQAKDNELLLSMPIRPGLILLVRLIGVYLLALFFELIVLIPAGLSFLGTGAATAMSVTLYVLTALVLPFLSVTLSCLLGWVLALIASHTKNTSFLKVLATLVFLGAYYYVYFKLSSYLQLILTNSDAVSRTVRRVIYPMYQMGRGCMGSLGGFAIFLLCCLVLFGLVYALLSRSFLHLATQRRSAAKTTYRETALKVRPLDRALLGKEARRFWTSSAYLLNAGMGALLLVIGAAAACIRGRWLADTLASVFGAAYLPLFAAAMVAFVVAVAPITAPSVSMEGKTLWILQSLPVSGWKVLWAKLRLHCLVMGIPTALCCLALAVSMGMTAAEAAALVAFGVVFVVLTGELGLMFNLKLPNLTWTNEAVAVKQSISVLVTMLLDWGIVLALAGLWLLCSRFLSQTAFLALVCLVEALGAGLLLRWLQTRGARIFDTL